MSDIQIHQPTTAKKFSQQQWELLRNFVAKDMTPHELAFFVEMCEERGLSPFAKDIYGFIQVGRNGDRTVVIITSIDGMRKKAEETGEYRGFTPAAYYVHDLTLNQKNWVDVFEAKCQTLIACRIGCRRKGWDEATVATVTFDAYVGNQYSRWGKDPSGMLEKCAMAAAIRRTFPEKTAGMYLNEEMMGELRSAPVQPESKPVPLKHRIAGATTIEVVHALWREFNEKKAECTTAQIDKYMTAFTEKYGKFGASYSADHNAYMTAEEMGVEIEYDNQDGETA